MFYDALANTHGLKHDPFKALVAPRPIGWISTLTPDGQVNLAPYSFFNAVGTNPNYVMFASGGRKDSLRNAEASGEFACSLATWDLREQMNLTSAEVAAAVDEMAMAKLTPAPCKFVRPPRVKESPVAFECKYHQSINLPGKNGGTGAHWMVIGLVVGIHIDDAAIVDGRVDVLRLKPIARLGYADYTVVDSIFEMRRPD